MNRRGFLRFFAMLPLGAVPSAPDSSGIQISGDFGGEVFLERLTLEVSSAIAYVRGELILPAPGSEQLVRR